MLNVQCTENTRQLQSYYRTPNQTLFKAITNGVRRAFRRLRDSMVWGSKPCMMSITRMAISQRLEPRALRFVKDSWPGVSMTRRPGTLNLASDFSSLVLSLMFSIGKYVAPICCVIPPASPSCTFVRRIQSSSLVLPASVHNKNLIISQYTCYCCVPFRPKRVDRKT